MTVFQDHPGLLERFRHGCRQAYETVYRRYYTDVFRLLRRGFVTGRPPCCVPPLDEERVLELSQEVFLRAFDERARLGYDGLRPYRPYLLRIAKNLCIDVARRENRVTAAGGASDSGDVLDFDRLLEQGETIPAPDVEETLDWGARLVATRSFLAGLPELEHRFVTLRFVEEHSQATVAAMLNVTRRCVRTLEKALPRQLEKHLVQQGLT
ncbi:RNA polymerase sigma factor [Myxococcota bacterium]